MDDVRDVCWNAFPAFAGGVAGVCDDDGRTAEADRQGGWHVLQIDSRSPT